MMKAPLSTWLHFKNEGQVTSHPEDEGEEDDVDSLTDPDDPATQVQQRSCHQLR